LQRALARAGITVSHTTLRRVLRAQGIRPRANRKRLEPRDHRDRERQFRAIRRWRRRFRAQGWPIVSVDCKKKELIGPFKNPGQTWRSTPHAVYAYDFPELARYKAVPYGLYDVGVGDGHVYVGTAGETPDLAVAALTRWWATIGRHRYRGAPRLLVLADGGGGNGVRSRRWKQQLQVQLADRYGLTITVCHFPPGASKWNPIEHRLFSQITQTWAGTPLTSLRVLLSGIRATRTATGLRVGATLLRRHFPTHVRVRGAEMAALKLQRHRACPQWNYTISPRKKGK
jgi:hypothetical protein